MNNADDLATFFVAWLSANDWFDDDYQFYKSLWAAVAASPILPDAKTISDAIHATYTMSGKESEKEKLKISGCAFRAGTILDYLRATQ